MLLVAESGSTKCDWLLADENRNEHSTQTMGFNPFFHDSNLVETEVSKNQLFDRYKSQVKEVFFYGAGCSSPERNAIIHAGLSRVFTSASTIVVDHDLTASALATTHGKVGIACILGTGSNSCMFDGQKVIEKVPALGYVLGDEGSGSFFGKQLLAEYLYHRLPKDLEDAFLQTYPTNKEEIFARVYNHANPNVYLAGFMPFITANLEHSYIQKMVLDGLKRFAEIHIACYPEFKEIPVHFVGSVAYHTRNILQQIAEEMGFSIGVIERRPIQSLVNYHFSQHT